MPFKSKSQQRLMFAKHPKVAKRWAHETEDIKALPEKVKEKKAGDLHTWFEKAKADGECICPSARLTTCPVHGNKARVAKGMSPTTPGEDKAKARRLSREKSKKASMTLLANVAVSMNAFELSKEGREKIGMNSAMIGSFLDELEKIAGVIGNVEKTVAKAIPKVMHKPGITIPLPVAKNTRMLTNAGSRSAPTNAMRAGAHAAEGTAAGVVPKSLGNTGTSFKPPSGSLTGTHIRSNAPGRTQVGTRVQPRSPGQGGTKINAPRPPAQATGTATSGPARPAAPTAAPPAASGKKRGLMGTLALGGAAIGAGAIAGHMLPQPQQQQQPAY